MQAPPTKLIVKGRACVIVRELEVIIVEGNVPVPFGGSYIISKSIPREEVAPRAPSPPKRSKGGFQSGGVRIKGNVTNGGDICGGDKTVHGGQWIMNGNDFRGPTAFGPGAVAQEEVWHTDGSGDRFQGKLIRGDKRSTPHKSVHLTHFNALEVHDEAVVTLEEGTCIGREFTITLKGKAKVFVKGLQCVRGTEGANVLKVTMTGASELKGDPIIIVSDLIINAGDNAKADIFGVSNSYEYHLSGHAVVELYAPVSLPATVGSTIVEPAILDITRT